VIPKRNEPVKNVAATAQPAQVKEEKKQQTLFSKPQV
jgi:hypothetical protein